MGGGILISCSRKYMRNQILGRRIRVPAVPQFITINQSFRMDIKNHCEYTFPRRRARVAA
jgi:hypothetical protein